MGKLLCKGTELDIVVSVVVGGAVGSETINLMPSLFGGL